MTRVLFYLPVVTPWWFDNIVAHLIDSLSVEAEVHVLAPIPWRNTGVGPDQVRKVAAVGAVHWHIVDAEGHQSLRTAPEDADGVVEFVRSIAPDYVLCRSADIATPARFPGRLVYLMEAGAPPFPTDPGWIVLQKDFWHHGALPPLSDADREAIDAEFADIWRAMRDPLCHRDQFGLPRGEALAAMGLPADRKIIALPLEYEHEEAFTQFHGRFVRNLDLIAHVAGRLSGDHVLAITNHPLNYRYAHDPCLEDAIGALGGRAHLVPNPDACNLPTDWLIRNCDGLIVQNTKAIYSGAFFGKPVLRLSRRPSAGWLRVSGDMEHFLGRIGAGDGVAEDRARRWFGHHLLHETFDAATISGAELLDRIDRPFAATRIAAGRERLEAYMRGIAA